MIETVQRRPWQVHLSTAIVMVLGAGIGIGLNLRSHTEVQGFSFSGKSPLLSETQNSLRNVCWYGWPFPVVVTQQTEAASNVEIVTVRVGSFRYAWGWNYLGLLSDLAVGVGLLFGIAYVSESVIRWRKTA